MLINKAMGDIKKKTALLLLLSLFLPLSAHAADTEIVMFGSKSCVYCQVFDREVAPNYHWSKAARRAPLKAINFDMEGTGGYALRGGAITVTPTFVMFKRGREVARIRGYPGKKNFYRMVNEILNKVK
jgi:Thioredoxin-like domain